MSARRARLALFPHADFERLQGKAAAIVGCGGLGAVAAEILARAGLGRLALIDYDTLEEANLNRLVYRADHIGRKKVDALKEVLAAANPDLEVATYPYDVTDGAGYDGFADELRRVDLVLGCVDTFPVRLFLNARCVAAGKPLIDGGASEDGINGSVTVVMPGKTPCYRCNRPALGDAPRAPAKRDDSGLCHVTSLPTTLAIVAALQCQEAFKLLLGFGSVAPMLYYKGLEGTLERFDLQRDPSCPTCGGLA